MSESKTRTYEIVSKSVLEKIQTESSNEELLEEVRLEILKNRERAKVSENYFSEPRKSIQKNQTNNHKNSQKSELPTKNQPKRNKKYKICEFCLVSVKNSKFLKHIAECQKNTAESNNLKKELNKVTKIKNRRNYALTYIPKNEVQISAIAKKLNKSSEIIIKLLRCADLNVSNENEYVDKLFADSISLFFNPKKEEEMSSRVKEYKICPQCSANITSHKFNLHISHKCPNRNKQVTRLVQTKVIKDSTSPKIIQDKVVFPNSLMNKIKVEKVSWTLLPQGEWLFIKITNHFKRLSLKKKWRNKPFDDNRLQKIEKFLKPNKCFIGNDEFEGYIVYCFDWTNKVILECPIYGNAIYIIKQGIYTWQEIAKVSKWKARTEYSEQVTVINHSDTWLERLEENLRYGF